LIFFTRKIIAITLDARAYKIICQLLPPLLIRAFIAPFR